MGFEYETLDGVRFLLSPAGLKSAAAVAPSRGGKERKEKNASAAALLAGDLPLFVITPAGGC